MKKRIINYITLLACLTLTACGGRDWRDDDVEIPDFNFQETIVFENSLSAYNIFQGNPSDLNPTNDFHLLELSSVLFTDFSQKQRLVKIPFGGQITRLSDGSIDFPDGTILTKTFYYYDDERNASLGKKIIETRVLIKASATWNVATYIWNQDQTDASLELNGFEMPISWIDNNGSLISTRYLVPNQNECIVCHQSNSAITILGPKLRNLNRRVEKNGINLNQLDHLQSMSILEEFQIDLVSQIVDYRNPNLSVSQRARAYLDMNCSHCHNPNAWEESAERDFDFRYETPLNRTGIRYEKNKLIRSLRDGEMPFIGTTLLDREGVDLIIQFIETL